MKFRGGKTLMAIQYPVTNISTPTKNYGRRCKIAIIALALSVNSGMGQPRHGTTVFLLVRDTIAYIAADSRTRNEYGHLRPDTTCKVIAYGNKIIGIGGILEDKDLDFSLRNELERLVIAYPADSIYQLIAKFSNRASTILWHWKIMGLPDSSVKIFIMGCEYKNNSFRGTGVDFTIDPFRGFKGEGSYTNDSEFTICNGFRDAINPILMNETTWVYSAPDTVVIDRLFSAQSNSTPKYVGGCTDIARLTKEGVGWIRKKQNCQ